MRLTLQIKIIILIITELQFFRFILHFEYEAEQQEKHSDKQLISAKGMSLLFHYGSNLTYALVVQPLSRKNCCCCTIVWSERIFERTWSAFVLSHHSFITIYIDFYIWTLDEYYQFYTFSFLHEQNSKM